LEGVGPEKRVMRLRLVIGSLAVIAVAGLAAAAPAGAVTLGFGCITNSIAGDCAIGSAQMTVDVADPGGSQIAFTFKNTGAAASSITDVYWDDGTLLGIASITNMLGVSFASPATPGNLPGANNASPAFDTTAGFAADSSPPAQPNGVNPGEQLIVTFNLQAGKTFADALGDLADGDLRIGIHVQGYATGGSESFVNNPVPEPGTLGLLSVGLLALAPRRERGRRKS
jgi:hypothetical protein